MPQLINRIIAWFEGLLARPEVAAFARAALNFLLEQVIYKLEAVLERRRTAGNI